VLQEQGYTTAAFSGNPLVSPWRNFDQGFEHFDGAASFRKSQELVPDALRWIAEHAHERFFLYLHLVDPHTPHAPPQDLLERFTGRSALAEHPDFLEHLLTGLQSGAVVGPGGSSEPARIVKAEQVRWLSDVYDAGVAAGDAWLGRLLALLDELALSETTVVAFTSDHGEELFDHGWIGHGHALHEELLRVPLVLAGPGISRGLRIPTPVSTRHLGPTLARLGGAKLSAAADALFLADAAGLPRQPVFFDTRKGRWNGLAPVSIFGLLQDDWLLCIAPAGQRGARPTPVALDGPELSLRHFSTSASDAADRAALEPERAHAMRSRIEARHAELAARAPARRIEAGAATMELLRGFGYAGDEEGEDE
jgi:arylsulfatase A-like enzyme